MKAGWKGIGFWVLVMSFQSVLSQNLNSVRIAKDSVKMGEPFYMHFQLRLPESEGVVLDFGTFDTIPNLMYLQDSTFFSRYADLSIRKGGKTISISETNKILYWDRLQGISNEGYKFIRDSVQIAIFDIGTFQLSGPQVKSIGVDQILTTEKPLITVVLPDEILKNLQDSLYMAPLKPIMTEPLKLEDFRYFIAGLILLLLSAVVIYYFKKIKRVKEGSEPIMPEKTYIPPHIKALQKLEELKGKQLWQKGMIKEYQSELTFIIREYIHDRFEINALEMTTGEILKRVPFFVDQTVLSELLHIADLVKFAKARPGDDIHERFLHLAIEWVENTKTTEQDHV
ncbi:MAG TPA: hypothetical protein PKC30_00575 [Saprospiraceae bacterium]|nr:hypothetical protein [Saprospiraceae bacterium]